VVWRSLRCYCHLRAMARSLNGGTRSTAVARGTTIAVYVGASMVLLVLVKIPQQSVLGEWQLRPATTARCSRWPPRSQQRSSSRGREFVLKAARLSDLVRLGAMPPHAGWFFEAAVLVGQEHRARWMVPCHE